MNFKIVVSDPKTRKAYQKEIDQNQSGLIGKKISDKIGGEALGLPDYELEITGGSDKQGFPMRKDIEGQGRKKVLLSHPPGFHPVRKGQRKRKSVRGNTISAQISQINTKIITYGKKSIEELWGIKEKIKAEEKTKETEKERVEKEVTEHVEEKLEPKKEELSKHQTEKESKSKKQKELDEKV